MKKEVSLFIPCLVDQVCPEMGLAMVEVLEHLGYGVVYHRGQTCCGQPAFNAGHRAESLAVARTFLDTFGESETVVCPSGSCTAMVRNFYPHLFRGQDRHGEARRMGERVFEFSEFLAREDAIEGISGSFPGRVGFHNSCHACRELRLEREPLALLERISGCEVVALRGEPVCCGFGGLFSVKYDPIATAMARNRLASFAGSEVDALVSNDPGCILHLRQERAAGTEALPIYHLAEFLARAMKLPAGVGKEDPVPSPGV